MAEAQDEDPALLLASTYVVVQGDGQVQGMVFLNEQKVKPKLGDDVGNNSDRWYLDTGASNHMTGSLEKFTELDKSIFGAVKFGDGSIVEIAGRGTVLVSARNGGHRGLTDVYYIPKLRSNIISLGQMEEHGCLIVLKEGFLRVFDRDRQLLMKVPRNMNRLYTISLKMSRPVCLLASVADKAWLWHARFGHLNFEALKLLAQQNMVRGLPLVNHVGQVCDGCLIGKQRRASFPKQASYRATEKL